MTAPNVTSGPSGPQRMAFARKRTGATGSSGGDGNYDSNGVMRMSGQGMPGEATGPGGGQGNWQGGTSHPPPPQSNAASGGPGGQPPRTFAQMQAAGQARPAPPQAQAPQQPVAGQLQSAVSSALQSPSRYDLPQVQGVQSALAAQLQQGFGASQKALDEEMARRGLSASTIGAGYQGDLQGQHDTALANMNASLMQNYAATQAQDLSASLGAGQNYQNAQNQQGLAQGALTGQYGGQDTLAAQQLAQQGSQFQQNLGLQSQLGLGNLGVSQQQANTSQAGTMGQLALGQAGLAQSGQQYQQTFQQNAQQFGQTYALQQAQQDLTKQVQMGQLSIAQANQQLAQLQNTQQYGLAQGALGVSQQQANTSSAAQQAEAAYQAGQTQLGQQTLAQSGSQFGQQQQQQQQQFQQQLAQALQTATMSNTTQNKAISNDLLTKLMSILGPNADFSKFGMTNPNQTITPPPVMNAGDTPRPTVGQINPATGQPYTPEEINALLTKDQGG